ncbi:protealysin inhibitor emfourin [uncultured Microbacterium sp.]|uniref:protealysin inhibitor emfourin n=1 Tax=uncultured Microbacterium sp. TaxID=191216 RepID=UPI0025EB897B|nr:protealysin inhibitor emfourin [uncultured Microbacterium sp.]
MPESADETDAASGALTILVVRSGGLAGISRRWTVEAPPGDPAHWEGLVDRCPWNDDPGSESGADRFVWRIDVRRGKAQHERTIPEEALTGPWRELVDAVRAAGPA